MEHPTSWSALYHQAGTKVYVPTVPYNPQTKTYRQEESRLLAFFEQDCRAVTDAQLGWTTTDEQWQRLYQAAWEEGHSSGLQHVVDSLDAHVALIQLFTEAQP